MFRRRHTSSGQVRSLYDGLSHLYTDCDSRLRHIPSTNYAEKKRKDAVADGSAVAGSGSAEHSAEPSEGGQRVKSPEIPVSPRISSPHRMSDSEKQQQNEAKKSSLPSNTATELGLMPVNLSILNETSTKKKGKKSQNLPAGVNERDVELFTVSQETAKNFLIKENSKGKFNPTENSASNEPLKTEKIAADSKEAGKEVAKDNSKDHGVPSQIAVPHLCSTSPGSSARYIFT